MAGVSLTFGILRLANTLRLPKFKNKHGVAAHTRPNGSDWNPAQWFQALIGELGEWAAVRAQFESGAISFEEYAKENAKELADGQTYLDLLAYRSLDKTRPSVLLDDAGYMLRIIAELGRYANIRKKYDRREVTDSVLTAVRNDAFNRVRDLLDTLDASHVRSNNAVQDAHPSGCDLGEATREKFNEVSTRVGADVYLHKAGHVTSLDPAMVSAQIADCRAARTSDNWPVTTDALFEPLEDTETPGSTS